MKASYHDLGISIQTAEYTDVLEIVSVQSKTFVETYNTDGQLRLKDYNLPRSVVEHYVYRSDFLERKIALWRERIESQSEESEVTIAHHEKNVVGFAHNVLDDTGGKVEALFILPEYQRRYIGQTLIMGLLERAVDRDVSLFVVSGTPAIGFYKYHGFEIADEVPPKQCPEMKPGKWLPLLKMIRKARDANFV